MDKLIASLIAMTREAANHANELDDAQLAQFVEEREQLVKQLKQLTVHLPEDAPERLRYREDMKQLGEWDAIIAGRMLALKDEAVDQMGKINVVRKQKNAYDSGYAAADSYYFDQRK
ncbi:flagellar protein FliT [Paenibacillus abyssi]|uniref:Flagellar protein FliT n=1 Tax=Paenibacillus abyssi TaxID=1340531 RepID=A0A917FNJ9_9BACL|nr:flagellar protein FliT [Paenibacillus abyssi]GGF91369.1 hypothetical protein GCM10010916_05790 [Paenibacillus abyssi]